MGKLLDKKSLNTDAVNSSKPADRKYTLCYYIGREFTATDLIAVDTGSQFGCFVFVSDFSLHFKEPVKNLATQIPIERLSLSLHICGNLQMQMQTDCPLVTHKNLFVIDISGHVRVASGLLSSSWLHDHALARVGKIKQAVHDNLFCSTNNNQLC